MRLNHNKKGLMQGLVFLSVALLLMERTSIVSAMEFKVGGSKGWTIPSPNAFTYNQWAEMNRFQIGDSLLFVYDPDNDLVMHVNQDDYTNCNTATPLATYSDGNSSFTFTNSGTYYFISGIKENCIKNEKLVIVVMSDRSNHSSNPNQTIPSSPSPSPDIGSLAPQPSGSIEIVPAPSGEQSPSVSPSNIIPSGQQAPASSSSSSTIKIASLVASLGACLGFSLLLDLQQGL